MKSNKTISLKGSCNAEFDNSKNEVYFTEYGEFLFKLSYGEIDAIKTEADFQRKSIMDKIMDFFKMVVEKPTDKNKALQP